MLYRRISHSGRWRLHSANKEVALCIYFAARPSNLRSEASRSRSNMEPRTRNLTANGAEATTTEANGAEATTAEANGAEATTAETNGAEATATEANGAEAKRGNLHSAASPWRAFANLKARLLVFILSFSSSGFCNRKVFVLVFPAASTHRLTIRRLRLS